MNGVVLVTEAQRTGQMVTLLIVALVLVAFLLALATIWYWRRTDPRKQPRLQPQYRRVDAASYGGAYDDRPLSGAGSGYGRREPAPTGQYPAAGSRHPGSDHWPPGNGHGAGGQPGPRTPRDGGWR